ncbi:MAG: GNAT family N-acetyltransferase [Actinomycetota bacterium]
MTSKPELRIELDPELSPELSEALLDLWTEVSNAGGAVGFVPPVTTEDVRQTADIAFRRIRDGEDHLVVAFHDDAPVGFLFLEQRPGELFRHWATIKRLQVHPKLQGSGSGGVLLEETHRLARRLGLEALHLTVRGGTGTERFYERYGYGTVARIPGVIRVAPDDTRDELYMVKNL